MRRDGADRADGDTAYLVTPAPPEKLTATIKRATVNGAHEYARVLEKAG